MGFMMNDEWDVTPGRTIQWKDGAVRSMAEADIKEPHFLESISESGDYIVVEFPEWNCFVEFIDMPSVSYFREKYHDIRKRECETLLKYKRVIISRDKVEGVELDSEYHFDPEWREMTAREKEREGYPHDSDVLIHRKYTCANFAYHFASINGGIIVRPRDEQDERNVWEWFEDRFLKEGLDPRSIESRTVKVGELIVCNLTEQTLTWKDGQNKIDIPSSCMFKSMQKLKEKEVVYLVTGKESSFQIFGFAEYRGSVFNVVVEDGKIVDSKLLPFVLS